MKIAITKNTPELPELVIPPSALSATCFAPEMPFRILQAEYYLMLSVVKDAEQWEKVQQEISAHPELVGADWVRENGELYLAGSWLNDTRLANQAAVDVMIEAENIVIFTAHSVILA